MGVSIVRRQATTGRIIPSDWRDVLLRFSSDIRDAWDERAAIIEYDGNEPRPTAERRAFECIVGHFREAEQLLQAHVAAKPSARGRINQSVSL
jgi:hypothetical protein